MPLDLGAIGAELRNTGFATRSGTMRDVQRALWGHKSWKALPNPAKPVVGSDILRPMKQEDAPRNSISAIFGLGDQPLHTDGSHLVEMPDILILHSSETSDTPTLTWRLPINPPHFLRSGVFTVSGKNGPFLAHAFDAGRLRFDPVCMKPSDHLSTRAVEYFEATKDAALIHKWSKPDLLLFIDNRRMLHGRQALSSDAEVSTRKLERLWLRVESK